MVILWFFFCFTSKRVWQRRVATIKDLSIESISNTKTNGALYKWISPPPNNLGSIEGGGVI